MITFKVKGNFNNTETFFKRMRTKYYLHIFDSYGQRGVTALSDATPVDSGKTANSWYYEVQQTKYGIKIVWSNSNVVNGVPIAVIIQYGHGTRNGGYVEGRDYINPVIQPIFDQIASEVWGEVTK